MSGMPWGGSEVLWHRAARKLQRQGHQIAVNYKWWPTTPKTLLELESEGAELWLRNRPMQPGIKKKIAEIKNMLGLHNGKHDPNEGWLEAANPDAVMITLGYHPDQIPVADKLLAKGIPYAINVQCASNFFFIHGDKLDDYRRWYAGAEKVLFVSEENQHKVETNIAMQLENAHIVANPFNVDYDADPSWPSTDPIFKIACVGRIHFQSKGQDLIVDVLRRDHWRNRPVQVSFYGHDQGNKAQLEELIRIHGLQDRLRFAGFVDSVEEIWEENHALLLPSRYEGAPLVVIEAMLCNRMAISTDIGRNRELMDDGESGFIAEGATIDLLDRVLERAWEKREQWKEMGQLAGTHIRERYPRDPVHEFAEQIKSICPAKDANAGSATV